MALATRMKIGFHVGFSGNLKRLTNEVKKMRGNVFQFYSRSIRGGRTPEVNDRQLHAYYNFLFEKKISNVIMLAPFGFKIAGNDVSSNIAVENPLAIKEIIKDLDFAKRIYAKKYIINAGYKKGLSEFESVEILKRQLEEILEQTDWDGEILIRNMSGAGSEIAHDLNVWRELVTFNERVKGALDFGRAFSAGYSFIRKEEADVLLNFLTNEVTWDNIPLIYINDSNRFSNSKKNEFVPLGDGVIGFHGYKNILDDENILQKIWMVENQPNVIYTDRTVDFLVGFHKSRGGKK